MHLLPEGACVSHTTLVIEGENGLTIIDPGLDITGRKEGAGSSVSRVFELSESLEKPVQTLIITHSHIDHIFNTRHYLKRFPDLVCIGHANGPYLNKLLKDGVSVSVIACDVKRTVDGIDYDFIPTPGHSKAGDDLSVFIPSKKIVHVGDLFQPQGLAYETADSISPIPYFHDGKNYLISLDMMLNLDFDFVVTGHGDVLGDTSGKRGLELTKKVLQRIKDLALKLTRENFYAEDEVICEWIYDTIAYERNFDKSQSALRKGEGNIRAALYKRFDLPGIQYFVTQAKKTGNGVRAGQEPEYVVK
jgi:glyoxylase-like metal-dependent hydrolase (beta-lactamase superfamily II)